MLRLHRWNRLRVHYDIIETQKNMVSRTKYEGNFNNLDTELLLELVRLQGESGCDGGFRKEKKNIRKHVFTRNKARHPKSISNNQKTNMHQYANI